MNTYCYSNGKEPSPKGLGRCAHLEQKGQVAKGADGDYWIVASGVNCRQYWKRTSSSYTSSPARTYYTPERRCPSGMIRNPETGRCVLRSGAIGREILGYTPTRRRSSSSRAGKVLNPETGIYVLRTGKIGKQVLADRRR